MTSAENTTGSGTSQHERAITRRILIAAFLVAVVVRAIAAWYSGPAQVQEIRYITIARGLVSGLGYTGLDNRFPDIIQPPLFPLLLAASQLLPFNALALARGVSLLMGALLVFPGAFIARRLFSEPTARRTAWLIAVYPLLAHISCAAITESTFTLLVVTAFLCLCRGLDGPWKPESLRWLILNGLLLGLSFLTRPEGLTYLAAGGLLIVVCGLRQRRAVIQIAGAALLPLCAFAAAAIPYLFWVHAMTGQWLLAPKAVLVQVHHSLVQEGQRENWKEVYDSLLFFEHVKFGLNRDSTEVRSHEEFDKVSVGLTDGLMVSEEGDVNLLDPSMAARMILRNIKELYLEQIKYGYVLPSLLLMLAGVGITTKPLAGQFRGQAAMVLVFLAASFSFLLTHVQSRFLYAAMPFVLPWIAEGWLRFEQWAVVSATGGREVSSGARYQVIRGAIAAAVLGLTLFHLGPVLQITSRLWREHRVMGTWIAQELGEGKKLMGVTPVVAYYAEGSYVVLPYADLPEVVRFARHKQVDFIVADRAEIPEFRPQLTSLLNHERPNEGLILVKALNEQTSQAIYIYKLPPEPQANR